MLCDQLPRARFAYLPTPLELLPRLSETLGGPQIYIKRDDRSGLAFGGNKPRIFEFVVGDALNEGANCLITSAGVQSNHLREVTSACNKLGLKSVVILCGATGQEEPQGNLLLFKLLGAEIHTLKNKDPLSQDLMDLMERLKAEKIAQGYKPYLLHRTSKSGMLGSVAHVNAAEELTQQFQQMNLKPDYVVIPSGSGSTTSGYVLGLKHLKSSSRVLGVALVEGGANLRGAVRTVGNKASDYLKLGTKVEDGDWDLLDQYIGPGHGVLTPEVTAAIRLVARTEGIFLDPTYNGKSMAAVIDQIRQGKLTKEHTIVMVHSGGTPALFVNNKELAAEDPPDAHAKSA